jgi:glyoxylase-like metal-dependent hydrolase (beta-lactamase superfamily II)
MFDFEKGCIRLIRGGKYPQSNSVFIDDKIRTVIDPASDEGKLLTLDHERRIEVIINSHSHEDHFLYNSRFPDAQLWVHALCAPALRDMSAFVDQFFQPADVDEKTQATWSRFFTEVVRYRPREPHRLLADGDMLDFGQTRAKVLHTPGHCPGHLCFHFPDQRLLFLADLDLVKAGPYYGDKASSIEDTISSLQRLAAIDVDVYLVSHGKEGVLDGDPGHIHRYLNVIAAREEKLLEFLRSGPRTIEEVTAQGIIYGGRSLTNGAWELSISEKAMMLKHLERLERSGMVVAEYGRYHLL